MYRCSPLIAPTKTRATGTHDHGAEESCTGHRRHSLSRRSAFSKTAGRGAAILQRLETPDARAGTLNRVSLPGRAAEWLTLIQRIWEAHRMRPYPRGWLTLSTDPGAAAKLSAILDLHVTPPPNSIVLHVDEKPISGTLAGEGRWAPRDGCRSRKRIGELFAALNPASGKIIARLMRRQQHREFVRFLNVLNREISARHQVHVILDNFAPHKHAATREWLSRHSRFKLHFSPAGMSWTNLVELFFSDLARRRLSWGIYASAAELRAAVADFIVSANVDLRFRIFRYP